MDRTGSISWLLNCTPSCTLLLYRSDYISVRCTSSHSLPQYSSGYTWWSYTPHLRISLLCILVGRFHERCSPSYTLLRGSSGCMKNTRYWDYILKSTVVLNSFGNTHLHLCYHISQMELYLWKFSYRYEGHICSCLWCTISCIYQLGKASGTFHLYTSAGRVAPLWDSAWYSSLHCTFAYNSKHFQGMSCCILHSCTFACSAVRNSAYHTHCVRIPDYSDVRNRPMSDSCWPCIFVYSLGECSTTWHSGRRCTFGHRLCEKTCKSSQSRR